MAEYRLTYPSVLDSEEIMLEKVKSLLGDHGVTGPEFHNFTLAVSEAFTNALIHGNKYNPEKQIALRIEINESCLVADIIDQGEGGSAVVASGDMPESQAESGRGLALIRHYASSVDLARTDDGGLKVTIRIECKTNNGANNIQLTSWR